MSFLPFQPWRAISLGAGFCLFLIIAGCSKKPPAAPPTSATNTAAKATPAASAASAPATATNAAPESLVARSVFEDKPSGKDPFFPTSERRTPKAPAVNTGAVPPPSADLTNLVVKTIIPFRRAFINNRSFAAGEEAPVRLPNGKNLNLRCLEVKETSVVVEVEGIAGRKELKLRTR
ncbi:MAG: hypothetical protein AB1813_16295 [Verrucomicrobiota bacterium]|jgi:hypothetical protein